MGVDCDELIVHRRGGALEEPGQVLSAAERHGAGRGPRVLDVSGELTGDLANHGRDMAVFKAYDPNGRVANAPMAWGAQPHKGYVLFSDINRGPLAVTRTPSRREIS